MTYTNTFGSATVPSAKSKFASFNLTTDTTFFWSYNSSDTTYQISDIMEVTTSIGLNLNFPAANQVSVGESALVRNTGSNQFTIKDAAGGTLGTVASGTAKLFYINDNTTVAGTWSVLTFGTGTSSADATTLQGLGLLAISATLNDNHPVTTTPTAYTVTTANRASTLVFTAGSVNATLPTLATAGNGFSLRVKNNGSGTITLVPQGVETIDQATLVPGESLFLVAGATGWVTVGYGRSTAFSFTRLNKSVGSSGTADVTLTSVEVSNKIINLYGTPGGNVNVVFPSIASIYFLSSALTTYTLVIKTGTGSTVSLAPGDATIVVCDGVNMSVALSSSYATNISLPSGSVAVPSLKFSASTNTGAYLPYAGAWGFVSGGAERLRIDNSSGVSTTQSSNTLEVGRIGASAWSPANLWVGYGSIQASYNGSVGINLVPASSSNAITMDTALDSAINFKAGNFYSIGTEFGYVPFGGSASFKIASTGMLTVVKGISDTSYSAQAPITGFSIVVANQSTALILKPLGVLATGGITFPAAPDDGQMLTISTTQTITALTLSGNGKTIDTPVTTLIGGSFAKWLYVLADTTWYRVG